MTINSFLSSLRRSFDSRTFRVILIALIGLVAVLAVFEAGMLVGLHEARSSYRWGEAYQRNFGGPPGGFIPNPGSLPNGNGAFGRIASTSKGSFIISDPAHPEETVILSPDTVIRNGADEVSAQSLTVGTYVVIIGSPSSNGTLDAKLIRIMPAPPQAGVSAPDTHFFFRQTP